MTSAVTYLVVGSRPWNRFVFDELLAPQPGSWHFLGARDELTVDTLSAIGPDRIFFLHWSWKVPAEILDGWECINFHMTDLPFGRGGSPLQNLIIRGIEETQVSAIRMTSELDAGPVYLKRPLALHGTAEAIFVRGTRVAAAMILEIIESNPAPVEQAGEAVTFTRRRPEESELPRDAALEEIHDVIRMLDATGYPHAFIDHGRLRLELTRAALYAGELRADVRITVRDEAPR